MGSMHKSCYIPIPLDRSYDHCQYCEPCELNCELSHAHIFMSFNEAIEYSFYTLKKDCKIIIGELIDDKYVKYNILDTIIGQ